MIDKDIAAIGNLMLSDEDKKILETLEKMSGLYLQDIITESSIMPVI